MVGPVPPCDGVMVPMPAVGVSVVVAVVRVPAPPVVGKRLGSPKSEPAERQSAGQKDGDYQPAPLMWSKSSSHLVLVSQKPLKASALMPPA